MHAGNHLPRQARVSFDVICVGEPQWKLAIRSSPGSADPKGTPLRPGGGAANVALALAREGLRVGLASNLPHDASGLRYRDELAAAGVDVEGISLAPPRKNLMLVDLSGGASPVASPSFNQPLPFEVPAGWSSQLLLLSGLSPTVPHAAALCMAARAGRRTGAFVLLDFNASLHTWAGRDPRTIRMVLREVDAARCSLADLAVVGMDLDAVRDALRPGATLVAGDASGGVVATGRFGEVVLMAPAASAPQLPGAGDAVTAALCTELARKAKAGESAAARWHRALARGYGGAAAKH